MIKKYVVGKFTVTNTETCPNCNGTGGVKAEVFDKYLDKNIDVNYICPQCGGKRELPIEGFRTEYEDTPIMYYINEQVYNMLGENFVFATKYDFDEENNKKQIENNKGLAFRYGEWLDIDENEFFDTEDEALDFIKAHKNEVAGVALE